MHSSRRLWQLEERVRNHLKLVPNTILAIMRPGCLILTATILRSSIKASRRQNIVHHGGATSCWLNTARSRSSFTPYTEHLNEYLISSRRASFAVLFVEESWVSAVRHPKDYGTARPSQVHFLRIVPLGDVSLSLP